MVLESIIWGKYGGRSLRKNLKINWCGGVYTVVAILCYIYSVFMIGCLNNSTPLIYIIKHFFIVSKQE